MPVIIGQKTSVKHLQSGLQNTITRVDVVRGSGGCRKIRWTRKGIGKSGGVRVIYYNMLEDETIWLLLIYAKNKHENIPAHILKAIKEEIICP